MHLLLLPLFIMKTIYIYININMYIYIVIYTHMYIYMYKCIYFSYKNKVTDHPGLAGFPGAFLELRDIGSLSCDLSAPGHSIIQFCTLPKSLAFQTAPQISKIRSRNVFGTDFVSSLDTLLVSNFLDIA